MEAVSKDFARCLVGTHLAFRSKGSEDAFSGVNLQTEISFLERESQTALAEGGVPCIMLLAELTDHYRTKPYYMAVRGGLVMHRYRPSVIAYMKLSSEERLEKTLDLLANLPNHDFALKVARYFVKNFPSKRKEFKSVLTHSEYLQISV